MKLFDILEEKNLQAFKLQFDCILKRVKQIIYLFTVICVFFLLTNYIRVNGFCKLVRL